jgi:hypothetical protein
MAVKLTRDPSPSARGEPCESGENLLAMDGCYIWESNENGQRVLLKGYLREEPFAWVARIIDNQGNEIWAEKHASPTKARTALVHKVPDEARFLKGAVPE